MKSRPMRIGADISEKEVEHQCDQLMLQLGWRIVRFSMARATRQTFGIPDRRFYPPQPEYKRPSTVMRRAFWMEVKRPGGKQSEHQRKFQAMVEADGEDYVLGGIPELVQYLNDKGIQRMRIA